MLNTSVTTAIHRKQQDQSKVGPPKAEEVVTDDLINEALALAQRVTRKLQTRISSTELPALPARDDGYEPHSHGHGAEGSSSRTPPG